MGQKKQLPLSLTHLQGQSVAILAAFLIDVTGKPPAADASKEQVLEELLKVADPAPDQQQSTQNELPTFKLDKKTYQVLIPRVEIPSIGIRTALELANDKDAQLYLIKNGSVGTVIAEVS
jgi:hypothetical protein